MEALLGFIGRSVSCPEGRGRLVQVMGGRAVVEMSGRGKGKGRHEAVAVCPIEAVRPVGAGAEPSREPDPRLDAASAEIRRIRAGEPSVWAPRRPEGASGPCGLCGAPVARHTTLTGTVLPCEEAEDRVRIGARGGQQYLTQFGAVLTAAPDEGSEESTVRAWRLHECGGD